MSENHRTAFILQIHKNPDQVNTFIRQLIEHGEADVFIHIDRRSGQAVGNQIIKHPSVFVLPDCVACEWGDISQVDATLMLLKAVAASGNSYDYVCLRSGQDLLVKNGFKEFLQQSGDRLYLNLRGVSPENMCVHQMSWPKSVRKRFSGPHPMRIFRRTMYSLYQRGMNPMPNRKKWQDGYQFYCGSQWFTIPFAAAEYILQFLEENEWFYDYFTDSYTPDEWFFHTLLMNSPFKKFAAEEQLLFLKWGTTFQTRNSPQLLRIEDIKHIDESSCFFARKFDTAEDADVIDYYGRNVRFGSQKSSPLIITV